MGAKKKERKLKKLWRRENSRYGPDWEKRMNKEIKEGNKKIRREKIEEPEEEKSD